MRRREEWVRRGGSGGGGGERGGGRGGGEGEGEREGGEEGMYNLLFLLQVLVLVGYGCSTATAACKTSK